MTKKNAAMQQQLVLVYLRYLMEEFCEYENEHTVMRKVVLVPHM
jgi:hypothetical protein